MSTQTPMLNQIGMPPPGRSIRRRRAEIETETAAQQGRWAALGDSRRQLVLSMIAFGSVLTIGLLVVWLVF